MPLNELTTVAALPAGKVRVVVTAASCPDGRGGGGGPMACTAGLTLGSRVIVTPGTALLTAEVNDGACTCDKMFDADSCGLDGIVTVSVLVPGLTMILMALAETPGMVAAMAVPMLATAAATLEALPLGNSSVAVTASSCPGGSGGGGGPMVVTVGLEVGSDSTTTPGTALDTASTKELVCTEPRTAATLVVAVDGMVTVIVLVAALTNRTTSDAELPGI